MSRPKKTRILSGMLGLFLMADVLQAEDPTVVAVPGKPALLLSGFDWLLSATRLRNFVTGTATSYKLAEAVTAEGNGTSCRLKARCMHADRRGASTDLRN